MILIGEYTNGFAGDIWNENTKIKINILKMWTKTGGSFTLSKKRETNTVIATVYIYFPSRMKEINRYVPIS